MKAAYVEQVGPPESIVVGELPTPTPARGEVLVRVRASAVNPVDCYVRGGAVVMDNPLPFIPGCDLAGEVEAVGDGATRFKRGDRVWGSNQGLLGRQGTLAEYAAVGEEWLYPTPDGVDDKAAAAGALVGITAHLGLVREAKLQPGEKLFVNGGSGGVGTAVIQIAGAMGAKIGATAGSEEKMQRCRGIGADIVINYKTHSVRDVMERQRERINWPGWDVWWETTREPDFDTIFACLAGRGRAVIMAGRDARPELPLGAFYVKGCSLHGFAMFNATPDEQRAAAEDLNRWLASGAYKPAIDRVVPLDQAAAAHKLQEENTLGQAGTLAGKIVVEC